MGLRTMELALILVLVCALWAGAMAQLGCTTAILGMAPCLNYITGNSSTPAPSCCLQLASVISSQPQCICLVLTAGLSISRISVNQTRALALPDACKVQAPPVSRCNSGGVPTTPVVSPAGSPLAPSPSLGPTTSRVVSPVGSRLAPSPSLPPSSSPGPSISSGRGSKATPSRGGQSSSGSIAKLPVPVLLFLVFIASSASVLNYS